MLFLRQARGCGLVKEKEKTIRWPGLTIFLEFLVSYRNSLSLRGDQTEGGTHYIFLRFSPFLRVRLVSWRWKRYYLSFAGKVNHPFPPLRYTQENIIFIGGY